MKSIRFVSVRGAVGRCFVLAFLFWTALLAGCAVFSPSPSDTFALDGLAAREAGAVALCGRALLAQELESKKGTNANPAAGVEDLLHAHTLLPDNTDILADYLSLAEQGGRYEEAYRCLAAYLRRHPDAGPEYHLTAAHFADRAEFPSEAADECARYLALCPTNQEVASARVRTLFDAGRDRDALRALRENRVYFHNADATNEPLRWACHFLKDRKSPVRALSCLEVLLEPHGDDPPRAAMILELIGGARLLMGETNAALRIWHKAFRLSPRVMPVRQAGEVLAGNPAAVAKLREAVSKPDAEVEERIQYAEVLLHLPPPDGAAGTNRVFTCGFRNLAESEAILRSICTRADSVGLGGDEDLFHWHLITMGELLSLPPPKGVEPVRFGVDDLVKTAREMIARFPKSASAKNFLAYHWAERGENLEEAHKLVNEALALEPANGAILDTKGWILFKLGRPYQALQFLLKAAEEERNSEIFQHAATVLRSLGRNEEAATFEKAIK
ncbi:MAG: hypothetical protein J5985_00490 [Kiritimatiellae bacterium]|nr:hypothetical protein [Kiritimatiellia bacterium]